MVFWVQLHQWGNSIDVRGDREAKSLATSALKGFWVEESFVNLVSCHDGDHEDVPEGPDEDDDPEHQWNEDRSQEIDETTWNSRMLKF